MVTILEMPGFRDKGVLADLVSSVSVIFSFFTFRKCFVSFTDPLKNNIRLPGIVITVPCTSKCDEIQQLGQDQRKTGVDAWSGFNKGLGMAVSSGVVRVIFGQKDSCEKEKWHMSIFFCLNTWQDRQHFGKRCYLFTFLHL